MAEAPSQSIVDPAPELSVVVPVMNEAENIAPLVREIAAALTGRVRFEIVYVDDGSTDDSFDRLRALRAEFPMLRAQRHARRRGQSAAVLTGVKAARAAVIATLDGDGQNNPADIPALLDAYRAHTAANTVASTQPLMLAGHRTTRRDSWIKRISSRLANRYRAGKLKDDTPDTGCGLKLFPRAVFLGFPAFDHMHRFLPALMIRAGGIVRSVPVSHRPRERGTSKYGTWDRLVVGLADVRGVAWLIERSVAAEVAEEI
jgi:dolichol-phosphate mannosyltransferase